MSNGQENNASPALPRRKYGRETGLHLDALVRQFAAFEQERLRRRPAAVRESPRHWWRGRFLAVECFARAVSARKALVTHTFPAGKASEAFAAARGRENVLKVQITF